ncbi:MAG: hypothetical protein K2P69_16415 [Eubacterium sp.]|nr:hypothetical protein [Eubacterium sp.]
MQFKWLRGRARDGWQESGTGHKTVCVTAGRWPGAGSMGLKGHPKGAFSGGEIQRLRRLRHEAHTPSVLVAVSD